MMETLDYEGIRKLRVAHIEKNIKEMNEIDAREIYSYTSRFSIYEDDDKYYFFDKYWPNIEEINKRSVKAVKNVDFKIGLFIQGFLPFNLTIPGLKIKNRASYEGDNLFWQFPCVTEKNFQERNKKTKKIYFNENEVNVYIPLPWATFIDTGSFNVAVIETIASRIKYTSKVLQGLGYQVKVHTCCQHVKWQAAIEYFKKLAITDLWLSHKKKNEDNYNAIKLHAWSLYATNYEDKSRSKGLNAKNIESKKYLASFVGAYMPHYLSTHRLTLKRYNANKNYKVIVNDIWHYEKIVYQGQMKALDEDVLKELTDIGSVHYYNKILSDSIFSLCPEGAGPNTIRLWESLAIGTIPVIISDTFDMPIPAGLSNMDLENLVINIKSEDIEKLDKILRNMSVAKVKLMQINGIVFYNKLKNYCILDGVLL